MPIPLDIHKSQLTGVSLVEASAGTGKTYSIAGVYLRLLVEDPTMTIDRILVVTFTEAATQELRSRIRMTILSAIQAFTDSSAVDSNDLIGGFSERLSDVEQKDVAARLQRELRNFDQAPIYTIHGLCHRLLTDYAFESRMLLDATLEKNDQRILKELADDFWRLHILSYHECLIAHLLANNYDPERLLQSISACVMRSDAIVIPDQQMPSFDDAFIALSTAYRELQSVWGRSEAEIKELLLQYAVAEKQLKAGSYNRKRIDSELSKVHDWFAANKATTPPEALLFISKSKIEKATKKNCRSPEHALFALIDAHRDAFDQWQALLNAGLIAVRISLIAFIRNELPKLLERRNITLFNDLLTRVDDLLQDRDRGPSWIAMVRNKFAAVMVDEFQDTDTIQLRIIQRLFCSGDLPVMIIGDPKQAIYAFRGADIFSYLEARPLASNQYHLMTSWRSERGFVNAVNTVFGSIENPFIIEDIQHQSLAAAGVADEEPLTENGNLLAPLQIRWIPNKSDTDRSGNKDVLREHAYEFTVQEILRLLSPATDAHIGPRDVAAADIAILVRRNDQALRFHRLLEQANVACTVQSSQSVFGSREADEIVLLLRAILEPRRGEYLRAALITDFIGLNTGQLYEYADDDGAWEARLIEFREYHDLWQAHGVMTMFRHLMARNHVEPRLRRLRDGERRLTNILHIVELIHQAASAEHLVMDGVLQWLVSRRADDSAIPEEYEIRLEKDRGAVTILTVHKSKGLEFPIVFCPFSWDSSTVQGRRDVLVFHKRSNGRNQLCFDLGSADWNENVKQAEKEQLSEELRLLYVATTRAINRCYLLWADTKANARSALNYLLLPEPTSGGDSAVQEIRERIRAIEQAQAGSTPQIAFDAASLAEGPAWNIPVTQPAVAMKIQCRSFERPIESDWKIASFSSFARSSVVHLERPDYDAESPGQGSDIVTTDTKSIMDFPRGAKAGNFFHELFNEFDFRVTDASELDGLVDRKLDAFGYSEYADFRPAIRDAVLATLRAKLRSSEHESFALNQLSVSERLTELEFYYPISHVSSADLAAGLSVWNRDNHPTFPEDIENLKFSPVKGILKGFIDLVACHAGRYFIFDWKSNHLGSDASRYSPGNLRAVMAENYYFLQYHLYVLALHRYLKLRLPDYDYGRHFGGVYYLFIRGVSGGQSDNSGIFYDRPEQQLIESMEAAIIDPIAKSRPITVF